MSNQRDVQILNYLRQFRVLNRNQLAKLCFPHNKNPQVVVNRVLRRLRLEGKILAIPRPKELCYLYMPNPTMIHPNSMWTRHYLAIAEFFIRIGKPPRYEVEPDFQCEYRPDAYMEWKGEMVCVEIQLTHISTSKMQKKVDNWMKAYGEGKHEARKLWFVTDHPCKLKVYEGFTVEFHKWTVKDDIIL